MIRQSTSAKESAYLFLYVWIKRQLCAKLMLKLISDNIPLCKCDMLVLSWWYFMSALYIYYCKIKYIFVAHFLVKSRTSITDLYCRKNWAPTKSTINRLLIEISQLNCHVYHRRPGMSRRHVGGNVRSPKCN